MKRLERKTMKMLESNWTFAPKNPAAGNGRTPKGDLTHSSPERLPDRMRIVLMLTPIPAMENGSLPSGLLAIDTRCRFRIWNPDRL
jgi:hypothetical protein